MTEKRTQARAIVTLTVEVHLDDVWGEGATVGQLYDQGSREAVAMLQRILVSATKDPTIKRSPDVGRIRIVGEPVVRQLITEERRS